LTLSKKSVNIDKSVFVAFEASSIQTSTRIPLPSTATLQITLNPHKTYTLETTTQMTSMKSALTPKTNILDISDANKMNKQTFEAAWEYLQTMVLVVVVRMLGGLTVFVVVALLGVYELNYYYGKFGRQEKEIFCYIYCQVAQLPYREFL
jgi:hypothetical protein